MSEKLSNLRGKSRLMSCF